MRITKEKMLKHYGELVCVESYHPCPTCSAIRLLISRADDYARLVEAARDLSLKYKNMILRNIRKKDDELGNAVWKLEAALLPFTKEG